MIYTILSDIHEDYYSLKFILKVEEDISNTRIVSLGDMIGFSSFYQDTKNKRDANNCIKTLKQISSICILGNHDMNFLFQEPINSMFKFPENWNNLNIQDKNKLGKNVWDYKDELLTLLSMENSEYLKSLPEYHIENNILFSHFLYPDLLGNIILSNYHIKKLLPIHFYFMKINSCKVSFIGHTHVEKPMIICETSKKITYLDDNTSITLSSDNNYIIFCPCLLSYNSSVSQIVNYNSAENIITFKKYVH